MQRWSTNEVAQSDRFDYWNGVICEAVLNVEARLRHAKDFRAELSANCYDLGHFVRFSSEPHEIERSRTLLRSKPDESYLVSLQLSGTCLVTQGDARFALTPGDIGIVSAARPMHLTLQGDVQRIVAVLPRRPVEAACSWLSPGTVAKVSKDRSVSRVLAQLMTELSAPDVGLLPDEEGALCRSVLDLLATCREMGGPTAQRRLQQSRLIAYLSQNLADPNLSPTRAASALGIAERTVHAQFAEYGTTCMRWIMKYRLEGAAIALRSSSSAGVSISEIAYRQGFSDTAHFSRRFKQAYGISPIAYRRNGRASA